MLSMLVTIDKAKLAAADGKIVKAAQFAQLVEAEEIAAEARRYAKAQRVAADAAVEAARKEGYEAGMQLAREDFAASVVETTANIEAAFMGLEARIVNTVMNAVQQILNQMEDRAVMERLIRRVLATVRSEKRLRLRVAAAQYDEVNTWLTTILRDFPQVEFIDVLKDPQGAPGTCVLESEFGVIDASLDTQLAAVRRGLINAFVGKRRAGGTT